MGYESGTSGVVDVVSLETPALGDRSYLVHDGTVAFVVDPQRDIDRALGLAGRLGVSITHVLETHLHNDYVSGGLALAKATGAEYHVNSADVVAFDRAAVADGDVIDAGPAMRIRALATPGHTFTHLTYALEAGSRLVGVFTGGSLLYGSTGRPDLLGPAHARELAHAQFASARRIAAELPDDAAVYPTHGFGSYCSATQYDETSSTIGREKIVNPALTRDEGSYVAELLAGLDAFPAYYARMGPANAAGPDGPDLRPARRAEPEELARRIAAGEWVVDLRSRTAFAAGHVAGTFSFAIDDGIATYLGWMIPPDAALTLLASTPEQIAEAQRQLTRIGIGPPQATATGAPGQWAGGRPLHAYRLARFADLRARRHPPATVVDVRLRLEWAQAHVEGAVHIPLHELPARLGELPDEQIWVYCRTGHRASIAASILDAIGRDVVVVDDVFEHAAEAGLPLEAAQPAIR